MFGLPILYKDPNNIEGEMGFDALFRHMSGLARRKIIQRTFEVYKCTESFLGIMYNIGVILRAEFTYDGMEIISNNQGLPIKWVTLSPYGNGLSINNFLGSHYDWPEIYSQICPFLYRDTHAEVMFSTPPTHGIMFHNLRAQVIYLQKLARAQISRWKHLLYDTKSLLSGALDTLGDYYNRQIEYNRLKRIACHRKCGQAIYL